jgi:hypothetical protein
MILLVDSIMESKHKYKRDNKAKNAMILDERIKIVDKYCVSMRASAGSLDVLL